jgi:hypothetical protein
MTNVRDFLAWCRGASSQDFATWGIAKMETFMIINIIVLHTVNYVLFLFFSSFFCLVVCLLCYFFPWFPWSCSSLVVYFELTSNMVTFVHHCWYCDKYSVHALKEGWHQPPPITKSWWSQLGCYIVAGHYHTCCSSMCDEVNWNVIVAGHYHTDGGFFFRFSWWSQGGNHP